MMECLKEIVGVSASDCECITEGLTEQQKAAIKKSASGIFMDDLPGGIHLKALDYADACSNLATMALRERDNAIKSLEDDLTVALGNQYKKAKPNFTGFVGRMAYTSTLPANGQYQGLRLRPTDYGDGVITLSRINLVVNASATFKVYVYRSFYDSAEAVKVAEFPVTTTANSWRTIMVNETSGGLKLPLVVDSQSVEYFVFFDRIEAGGAAPKDNVFECSTCGDPQLRLSNFIQAKGVQFTSLTDFTQVTADDFAHGFVLDVSVKCDNEQLFCRGYKEDDAVAVAMARAVWFKAGELLIDAVLKSPEVSRYTTMAREYLWGKRNHFRSEYESRIVYLADSIDVTASNCYVCRHETNQPFFSGIYS